MPKQKTNSSAKKRFKVTGAGRILRRHAMKSHNLEKKSREAEARASAATTSVDGADDRELRKLLGSLAR